MIVIIKDLAHGELELEVELTDTVGYLKTRINQIYGYVHPRQRLTIDGKWFVDQAKICDCITSPNPEIILGINIQSLKFINIIYENKSKIKHYKIKLNAFTLVEDIKFIMQDKIGISYESIKLYIDEFELEDKLPLFEYGVPTFFQIRAFSQ